MYVNSAYYGFLRDRDPSVSWMKVLGTGTGMTSISVKMFASADLPNRNTSFAIKHGSRRIMIDLGLANYDLAYMFEPTEIVITHMHPDHIGGLAAYLMYAHYGLKIRPRILVPESLKDLLWQKHLEEQFKYDFKTMQDGTHAYKDESDIYELVVLPKSDSECLLDGGLSLTSWSLTKDAHHTALATMGLGDMPSTGLLLRRNGKKVLYTSDMIFMNGAGIPDYADADIVVHDCALSPPYVGTVHTHSRELNQLPEHILRKMILVHTGPLSETNSDNRDVVDELVRKGAVIGYCHEHVNNMLTEALFT